MAVGKMGRVESGLTLRLSPCMKNIINYKPEYEVNEKDIASVLK